jgi:hypothetical protein
VAAHVAALRAAATALIIGVYALWTRPTGAVVIWLTLALVVIMAVIEFFRRGAALPAAVDGPATDLGTDEPTLPMVPEATPSRL